MVGGGAGGGHDQLGEAAGGRGPVQAPEDPGPLVADEGFERVAVGLRRVEETVGAGDRVPDVGHDILARLP